MSELSINTELSLDTLHKVRIIGEINDLLLKYGQEPVCTDDFDTLYALDVQSLRQTKNNIKEQLKSTAVSTRR